MNPSILAPRMDLLDIAGHMLEKHDCEDVFAPGLLEMTGVSQHGMATASGLNDYDYQTLSTLSMGHKTLNQVQTINKIPIPPEILEHFKHIKCHCMMGLFPEISRAWLTIDSEIYIWTYEQTRDVAYYDGLNHLIVSVGLVKPKESVFINDVKYLLILTTPIEIIILGVTFGNTTKIISSPARTSQNTATFQEMQLMNKPVFILPTDNVSINVIQGCDNGRIFLGGRDGCLYEISYKAESNWFGKRCRKINLSQSIVSYMVPSFLKVFSEVDPIVRLAVDDSRQFLYVLTEKGSIEAWHMGEDSYSMYRIAKITQNDIVNASSHIIKTVDSSVFRIIKAICPLTDDDCPNLHLMAVTQCGVRLYFSTTPLTTTSTQNPQQHRQSTSRTTQSPGTGQLQSQQQQSITLGSSSMTTGSPCSSENKRSQFGLYLLHVRLPPGYTPNTTTNKPKEVHSAYYSDKTLLLVSTPQHDQDILWSISSAPFPHRPYLTESTTVMPMDGIVWCMAETSNHCIGRLQSVLRKALKPKKVVLLSNQGAHIIALLKPVDLLQQLLIACHGPHHEAVKAFFQAQGEKEACATSLLLTCSEQYRGTDLAMWAAQAFMLYGGEPTYINQMQWNVSEGFGQSRTYKQVQSGGGQPLKNVDQQRQSRSPQMLFSTPITNSQNGMAFNRIYQQQQQQQQQTLLQSGLQQTQFPLSPITNQAFRSLSSGGVGGMTSSHDLTTITYSAKHNGLYLYVARLVRPIWKMRCIDVNFNSTLTQEDCILMLEDLHAIRSFLDVNAVHEISCTMKSSYKDQRSLSDGYTFGNIVQLSPNINATEHHATQQLNVTEQAQAEEKRSLIALNFFIKHTSEVISLWKILCEHQFNVLVCQLQQEQQRILISCTFRDLILSRSDTCALLIVALINSYLKDTASVSSISAKLRDVCPNLYRHEDAVSFKATEILMNAKNCTLIDERDGMLRTALQLCKDAAPNLPLQNLCQQFTLSGFYEGVIELTSTCASKIDPEEFAIHYHQNDEPEEDGEGYTAYAARMTCYKEVRNMLDHIYQTICTENANKEFPNQRDNCMDNINEFNTQAQLTNVIKMALRNKDPLLHMCVYSWLLSHDMLAELLCISEPSLGEFLRRNVLRNADNLKLIDLLWKYYEKNGHHSKAARILDNLASIQSDNISLDQRIEHLARAVMCMRNDNVGYSISDGVLLKELEDKLEIARVQKTVLDAISELAPSNIEAKVAVKDLNRTLYDITQLYELFAEPFHLWECKLTILKCSHHNDPLLIESVWGEIINKAAATTFGTRADTTEFGLECSKRLFSKMENLIKEFGESGHCFPLSFIIRELEIKACQLRLPEGIVPEKLLSMNIDIELLMEYYSRMISINERIWANEGNEWHLVQSSIAVVNHLANSAHTLWSRSKRRIIGKAQDMVSVCLNLCYQKPGTERMQHSLKELQCRLQRALT